MRIPRALPPMKGDCRAGEATGARSTSSVGSRNTYPFIVGWYIYIYVYIYIYIWVNYNISLTWTKAIWGWFPLLTMIPVRSQWGRYNLPRYIYIYRYRHTHTHIYIYIYTQIWQNSLYYIIVNNLLTRQDSAGIGIEWGYTVDTWRISPPSTNHVWLPENMGKQ